MDFLVTALFFGLVLFAWKNRDNVERDAAAARGKSIDSVLKASGISDIRKLTDELGRLGPMARAESSVVLVERLGGEARLRQAEPLIATAGGVDSVRAMLQMKGFGLPPCLFSDSLGARKTGLDIATIRGTDSTLSIESRSPAFKTVLRILGRPELDRETFTFAEFARIFSPLHERVPQCWYFVKFIEATNVVFARDAVGIAFRTHRVHLR